MPEGRHSLSCRYRLIRESEEVQVAHGVACRRESLQLRGGATPRGVSSRSLLGSGVGKHVGEGQDQVIAFGTP